MAINGTSGNDTLTGTTSADTIYGGAGNDSVVASDGNDLVYGQTGDDTLLGGTGNDTLTGAAGADLIDGGAGPDNLTGGQGRDTIIGGTENDSIIGDGQWYDLHTYPSPGTGALTTVSVLNSADGPIDLFYINSSGASVYLATIPAGGSYSLSAHQGDNYLLQEPGTLLYLDIFTVTSGLTFEYGATGLDDLIEAGSGDDTVYGQYGNDTIYFGDGNDTVYSGTGNDLIDDVSGSTLPGANVLDGGAGDDTIYAGAGNDTVLGGTGNDMLVDEDGNDSVTGGDGADTFWAGTGDDVFYGGADGDHFLFSGAFGNDTVWGDSLAGTTSDHDVLGFTGLTSAVSVTFTDSEDGTATSGPNTVTFDDIEAIDGTTYNDTFNASADASGLEIYAQGGDDTVIGGSGADMIRGGTGNDSLTTGTGADTLVFSDGDGNDIVTDFDMTLSGAFTTDQLNVSGLTNTLGNPVTTWDVVVSDDGAGNAVLTFPAGESITLIGVTVAQVSTAPALHSMGIPCIMAGMRVATPRGPVAIERLVPGDLVNTCDGAPLPVLWAGRRQVSAAAMRADPRLVPVEIKTGAMGNARALRLSALHGLWVPEGPQGSLARAGHLARVGWSGARVMHGLARHGAGVSYHHLLLPHHALIAVEGAWIESFWPGKQGFAALDVPQRQEVIRALPRLAQVLWGNVSAEQAYGLPARPFLKRYQIDRAVCAKWSLGADEVAHFDGFITEPSAPKAYRYKRQFGC